MKNKNDLKDIIKHLKNLTKKTTEPEVSENTGQEPTVEFLNDLKEEDLTYYMSATNSKVLSEIENRLSEIENSAYDTRHLEWMSGTFFWNCILYSGGVYKPIFDKNLFEAPCVSGEIKK